MKENITRAVYVLNNAEGITEFGVLADSIEQRNGWILALWHNEIIGGVKEEYLKAFYLEVVT
jgi:hypothetical protein